VARSNKFAGQHVQTDLGGCTLSMVSACGHLDTAQQQRHAFNCFTCGTTVSICVLLQHACCCLCLVTVHCS
jgi:hypothetical protein